MHRACAGTHGKVRWLEGGVQGCAVGGGTGRGRSSGRRGHSQSKREGKPLWGFDKKRDTI